MFISTANMEGDGQLRKAQFKISEKIFGKYTLNFLRLLPMLLQPSRLFKKTAKIVTTLTLLSSNLKLRRAL